MLNSVHDDGLPVGADAQVPATAYTGIAPPPTQAPANQSGEALSFVIDDLLI